MGGGDVAPFHRFARLYDLCMYSADVGPLERGLALAERPVERVLDVGGGTGRVARALEDYDAVVVDAPCAPVGSSSSGSSIPRRSEVGDSWLSNTSWGSSRGFSPTTTWRHGSNERALPPPFSTVALATPSSDWRENE